MIKLTQKQAEEKCIKAHPEKYANGQYTLEKFVYKTVRSISIFMCTVLDSNGNIHGEFSQKAKNHFKGQCCPKCAKENFIKRSKDHTILVLKRNKEVFIEKANHVHDNKYEYLTEYTHSKEPIKIKCKKCNHIFERTPTDHLNGLGCSICKRRKYYLDMCFERNPHYHELYDVSESIYVHRDKQIKVRCKKCGKYFDVIPSKFKNGIKGCKHCGGYKWGNEIRYTQENFVQLVLKKQPKYISTLDFSGMIYTHIKTEITVKCIKHNYVFKKKPSALLQGYGCPICGEGHLDTEGYKIKLLEKRPETEKYFGLDVIDFKNNDTKVKIFCKSCKKYFDILPYNLVYGQGCSHCKASKGEKEMCRILDVHTISYKQQHTYPDLRWNKLLRYDFYLFDYNLCVEYQGEQHYRMVNFNGHMTIRQMVNNLAVLQMKDEKKHEYCEENGIPLLCIHYKDKNNISKILKGALSLLDGSKVGIYGKEKETYMYLPN
jgi:formylmethanofuran dehydrogenase subunit E